MSVYRFKDVRGFEAAMGHDASRFSRFTLTPLLAAEWFGLSARAVTEMIGAGGLDAVVTDDGYTFLDASELAAYEVQAAENPATQGWFAGAFAR